MLSNFRTAYGGGRVCANIVTVNASLTQRTTSGVLWSGGSQAARQLLTIFSFSILAHHIDETAYGLVSMATVFTAFVETFRDFGTTTALVQQAELTDRLISTVFWINMLAGTVIALCLLALSIPGARFFGEPQLARILQVVSLNFVIGAVGLVPTAMLMRRMQFRWITLAQLAGVVSGTAAAITMALQGLGVWSLVIGTLMNTLVSTVVVWVASPCRNLSVLDWESARKLFSFSANLSGFNILNYVSRNADNLIVGRFLGKGPLGFYQMSYSLMTYPISNFSGVLCQVLFPALVQVRTDMERFRSAYIRACMLISLVTFPAMLGLTVTADPFVRALLGEHWMPVAGLLKIFGPLGMAQSVFTTIGLIYNAQGRVVRQLHWGIVAGTFHVISFFAGLPWGITGIAISYATMWTLLMVPGFLLPFRLIELSGWEFFRHLWPVLKASLIMAAVAESWMLGLREVGVTEAWVTLVSTSAVGCFTYLALLRRFKPPVLKELRNLLDQYEHPIADKLAWFLP